MTCPTAKITPQHPIGSGFGAETTTAEVIPGIEWSLSETDKCTLSKRRRHLNCVGCLVADIRGKRHGHTDSRTLREVA